MRSNKQVLPEQKHPVLAIALQVTISPAAAARNIKNAA